MTDLSWPPRDAQRESTGLHQVALPLARPVDPHVIVIQPTLLAAINLCISAAGREPKAAYMELEIDKGHWSRIQSGQNSFPTDKLLQLMDAMGNDIPLQWLAYRRGKGLHLLESEQQRLMREKDEEIAQLRQRLEWQKDLITGRQGA